MRNILFLTLAEVVVIHTNQIELYGGLPGIRDINLLSSAIAMPHASFHGEYLHNDIYEMAAAYAFHIGKNHPFVDGNKRTALVSTLVFLELNGISISDPQGKLYDAMLDLSTGKLNKSEFASVLRKLKD
ncbi:MAG: type II toxin-antitoxin system death-on-curing family toxin [Candidatus Brocadia sp. AMX2]|nr:MAG: type II toxin-antitoxin system death-on-curing family toxin [Candidatus Brocadia sp. AMX2]MBC6931661.1 type II toxin-antitoxin system death-on-curing family toxin [Candidatus Brocadia sp.]MBL1168974.1 type II toxin-antitoxin system death-on-curing family toxin [Candidatus Brocadia sp. AMX1]NOG43410.1 type II toxin-antitoxin system death-on-curing family toxin [Planctomycetota bacterium]MCE7865975.1 type II toxin-antitoxin system death-on-curing family toxin [Candidatus Brocadia sp. AMX2